MAFFILLTFALLLLSNNLSKVIISLTNVILILTPLIGILFGSMYYYNYREYIELLLAQPLSRKSIFSGIYLGLAVSLSLSLVVGIFVPMTFFGIFGSVELSSLAVLLVMAIVLSIVFSLIAFVIALKNDNRIKGFGIAIFIWLFFALIYDGIFLLMLLIFKEYPLENLTLGMTIFNPIDLARILILFKLDFSAMMGYTGAVLEKFLGSWWGSVFILISLTLWMVIPYGLMLKLANKKDF
jgi:Cu-processing system permease protein